MKNHQLVRVCLKSIILFVIFFSNINKTLSAQELQSKLDKIIDAANEQHVFNGVVLVAEKGEIVFTKAIGYANIEWEVPHTLDSKFQIASVSKQFTCNLILQLVDEGKIKLDAKINDYLPDYPSGQGSKVTISHLMAHTSGIPNYSNLKNWYSELWIKELKPGELLKSFNNLDLEFEPGSKFSYSNSGYFILGQIIEKVTGKSFEKVVAERIIEPLGLKNTGVTDINSIVPRMSYPYEYWKGRFTRSDYYSVTHNTGTGFIYTTALDLFKWHLSMINSELISLRLTKEMMKKQIVIDSQMAYGFGLFIGEVTYGEKPVAFIEHEGAYPGFITRYSWFPDSDRVIILMNNTGRTQLGLLKKCIYLTLDDSKHECEMIIDSK